MTNQKGYAMEAVTGQCELKTGDTREVERFVKDHLAMLEGHEITIRKTNDGYLAEFYSMEPTA